MESHPGVSALERSAPLGVFTAADAARHGISSQLLSHHTRSGGRWQRLYLRVYLASSTKPEPRQWYRAAILWGGPSAVLSHRAAATILRLDGSASAAPELWAERSRGPDGLIVHRGSVPAGEVATTGLLPHTTAARTIHDLATIVDDDTLELAIESVLRGDPTAEAVLRASRRHAVRKVLDRRRPGEPATGSELETRFVQLIRRVDLPPPVRQFEVLDRAGRCVARLDLAWPEAAMWVELDGRRWHDRAEALLYDRHRQNAVVTRLGWVPIRFTWVDVVHHPLNTARETARAYRSREHSAS